MASASASACRKARLIPSPVIASTVPEASPTSATFPAVTRGKGPRHYATKFLSSPGQRDGLYWPTKAGEPESPLGPLVAKAQQGAKEGEGYYGYHYRLLYSQGPDAPGAAYSYLVNGRMLGGFAVIAWPVKWGETGVMTFMVSHSGIVVEKDLGPSTDAVARAMTRFNPDSSWHKAPVQ